jgi:hypothetical protein
VCGPAEGRSGGRVPMRLWRYGRVGGVWASGGRVGGAAVYAIVVRLRGGVKGGFAPVKA